MGKKVMLFLFVLLFGSDMKIMLHTLTCKNTAFQALGHGPKATLGTQSYCEVIPEFVSTAASVPILCDSFLGSEKCSIPAKKHASLCLKKPRTHFKDEWVSEKRFPCQINA